MAIIRTYKCPCPNANGEFHTFDFMHHPSDEPPPRFCPKCGYDSAETTDQFDHAVTAPHVRAGAAKAHLVSADQTYRQYEQASEARAQDAANLLGVPVSEMSDLKVTNMETSLREGDQAVKAPSNPVSQMIESRPGVFGFQDRTAGASYATNAHTGVMPDGPYRGTPIVGDVRHAGAKAGNLVREFHMQHAERMVKAGETGRH